MFVIVQCYVVTSHKHDGRGEGGLQAAAEEPGGLRGEDIMIMMMIMIMIMMMMSGDADHERGYPAADHS